MHRSHVNTLAVLSSVTKHAHRVLNLVHGLVPTKDSVHCPAQHLVTDFHATSAAPSCFLAPTNVLESAEKIVFRLIAKSVE